MTISTEDQPTIEDVEQLLNRIDSLQSLLAVYRTQGRPSEALFKRLEKSKANEDRIRDRFAS